MYFEVPLQALQEEGRDFRMVQDLEGDNASEPCRGVSHNIAEVAVQGEQDRAQLLRLGDY